MVGTWQEQSAGTPVNFVVIIGIVVVVVVTIIFIGGDPHIAEMCSSLSALRLHFCLQVAPYFLSIMSVITVHKTKISVKT